MNPILPLPLRRSLLAALSRLSACSLLIASLSITASGSDYTVDSTQASSSSMHMYQTLEELRAANVLAIGDTVILKNDDSTLTGGLTVPVNFRSDNPETPHTVDLSSLNNALLFDLVPGDYTLGMDFMVWANSSEGVIKIGSSGSTGDLSLAITGAIQFLNNQMTTGNGRNGGAAVYIRTDSGSSTLTFGNNAQFSGNVISGSDPGSDRLGSAVYINSSEQTTLTFGDNAQFSGNGVRINSRADGGAIYAGSNKSTTVTFGANAQFSGNYIPVFGLGGAIHVGATTNLSFLIRDGAVFTNNYGSRKGGAIYLRNASRQTVSSLSRFLALNYDVHFYGNMTGGTVTLNTDGTFSVQNGIANAVYLEGPNHLLQLAAAEGRMVRFDDPIIYDSIYGDLDGLSVPLTLTLNQYTDDAGTSHATGGTVIFSGELYQGSEAHLVASRYSDFKGQTTLYGGTLILEHNVVFGNKDLRDDTSMTLQNGTLEITGGSTINAAAFTVASSNVILRPGTSAFINAKNVDLSRGFVFDMQKQLQTGGSALSTTTSGLTISASTSFALGGAIGIMDSGVSANHFYADNSWAQQRTFTVLTDSNQNHTGDFSGALFQATGSDQVDSPYTYTGTWSHQWVDTDANGFADQLQLVWTPAPGNNPIQDILPELAGGLAMNSMWSSSTAALGMASAALDSLDAPRFTAGPENNYWIKGLGNFLSHGSKDALDGFDYNGGGYAVGADRRVVGNIILGVGFGDLYGRTYSRSFAGDIGQQTRTGLLYGGWYKNLNNNNALMVTGSAGYGWTDNKMNSGHTGGWSHGNWSNRTLSATLNGTWSRRLNEALSMELLLGLEYTDVTQEAFTETGWDARRFEKGCLKNLSLPAGVGLSWRSELKGREWTNSVTVSYVPDVYRENPSAGAQRLLNGYRWEAKGMEPGRNAVRANVSSTLQLNARWRTYAGYEFEGRKKSAEHRLNAGVSYAF